LLALDYFGFPVVPSPLPAGGLLYPDELTASNFPTAFLAWSKYDLRSVIFFLYVFKPVAAFLSIII